MVRVVHGRDLLFPMSAVPRGWPHRIIESFVSI